MLRDSRTEGRESESRECLAQSQNDRPAAMRERLVGIHEVNGSNPLASTSFSLTLRLCAESRCSPEGSDGFEAGQIRWPHRIEVGFGQRRLSFLHASLVI